MYGLRIFLTALSVVLFAQTMCADSTTERDLQATKAPTRISSQVYQNSYAGESDDQNKLSTPLKKSDYKDPATAKIQKPSRFSLGDYCTLASFLLYGATELGMLDSVLAPEAAVALQYATSAIPVAYQIVTSDLPYSQKVLMLLGGFISTGGCEVAALSGTPFFGESYGDFKNRFNGEGPCEPGTAKGGINRARECLKGENMQECSKTINQLSNPDTFAGEYHRGTDGVTRVSYGSDETCFYSSLEDGPVVKACMNDLTGDQHTIEVLQEYSLNDITKGLPEGTTRQVLAIDSHKGESGCGWSSNPTETISPATAQQVCINYEVSGKPEASLCFNPDNPSELKLEKSGASPVTPDQTTLEGDTQVKSRVILPEPKEIVAPEPEVVVVPEPGCNISLWGAIKAWLYQTALNCEGGAAIPVNKEL